MTEPRKADIKRWQKEIEAHLGEIPRQVSALENAMAAFGDDFGLKSFKAAYETQTDMDSYNLAQAVERALGRVQNFVSDLATSGVKLAQLPLPESSEGGPGGRAFGALKDAGVIDPGLCRRLKRAQRARTGVEHDYVKVPAGNVHAAAILIRETSVEFIGSYRTWIEPYLAP
jgi:uncharacterized protein YutE (UPF0331/DUF86 family)